MLLFIVKMIFLQLFYTFLIIGAFTFGGGYSMIALIQDQVVVRHQWLTQGEFTDLLAVSQMTPGPVGINTATYAGYTAVVNAGYSQWAAVGGSLIASLAVLVVPVALVMLIGSWLMANKEHPVVASILRMLRLAVIGLIAAAALSLFSVENFGTPGGNLRFMISVAIFAVVFLLAVRRRVSPIFLILASAVVGVIVF